jgi:glutamine amidotransferase
MIGVIDYGMSNLACVCAAVEYHGYKVKLIKSSNDFLRVKKIILPGVGAFGDAMNNLHSLKIIKKLNEEVVEKKKKFLGICLGAQLICKSSDEHGYNKGIGWIDAKVNKLKNKKDLRIPHTGWNNIILENKNKKSPLLKNINEKSLFFFTHSFGIKTSCKKNILASCRHSETFASIIIKDNIYGMQFHPEKSQKDGLEILKNFLSL